MESELEPYRATFQGTLLANSLESMNSSISSAISYTVLVHGPSASGLDPRHLFVTVAG